MKLKPFMFTYSHCSTSSLVLCPFSRMFSDCCISVKLAAILQLSQYCTFDGDSISTVITEPGEPVKSSSPWFQPISPPPIISRLLISEMQKSCFLYHFCSSLVGTHAKHVISSYFTAAAVDTIRHKTLN